MINWNDKLFVAVKDGNQKGISKALQNGADVAWVEDENYDILSMAVCFFNKKEEAIIKMLILHGADPNFLNSDNGKTPLFWALENLDFVKILINAGANIDAENPEDGYTSIHSSVEDGNMDLLLFLIGTKCKKALNMSDFLGRKPLTIASENGNIDIAKILLSVGANINGRDELTGKTALGEAINQGKLGMVKFLLSKGANPKLDGWMTYDNIMQAENSESSIDVEKVKELLKIYSK